MTKANSIPVAPREYDLCLSTGSALQSFVLAVTDIATFDFQAGRKRMRSGREICDHLCTDYRKGHMKLASHLYSHVHWSLDCAKREADALAARACP